VSSQFSSSDIGITGNLGVGTTSPTQAIEAAGNIFINTSGNPFLEVKTSGAGNNPFVRIKADSNYWDLQTLFSNTNNELDFRYNGTSTMMIDNSGAVTKPLQPACLVTAAANADFAVNTTHTVNYTTEVYDQNGDFSTTNNQFTAPVTGRYLVTQSLYYNNVVSNATYLSGFIYTSNRTYTAIVDPGTFDEDSGYHTLNISVVADLDANDVVQSRYYQAGGSATTDLVAATFLSVCLLA